MDSNIRTLLATSQKSGGSGRGWESLQEAYGLLRHVAKTKPTSDAPEAFSQDLYILCAETAFQQYDQADMAKECLKMYFMKTPPANQFLVRAHLCQAQLLAPVSAENPGQLEKALVYLIKAIDLGKENTRYHFLVYNASVLYWRFCRPFLKPNYRHYLASSLQQLVKALDDIDDKDYSWRAQLMIALIECHMDVGHRSDATTIATTAAAFIKKHVPSLYKKIFGLMVRHQLVDSAKFQKELKTSPELHVYYRICKVKLAIDQRDTEVNVAEEMTKILQQVSGQLDPKPVVAITKEKSGTSEDLKRSTSRQGSRQSTMTSVSITMLPVDCADKPYLLLELARLALQQDLAETAQQAMELIKESAHLVKDPSFFLEVEFLQDELMVRSLAERQESYQKPVVEVRLAAIKKCDEAIQNAVRVASPGVVQAGCVTQWNLCLPLLQPNLRSHVRKPLTVVAQALENIQSLLIQLRCQVHMEVSKCEEDEEQINVALEHLTKALALDDGAVYNERLQLALHRLQLRAELYQQPNRPEDEAAMIIEQARKADSGTMRMKRSLLVKAGQVLAPDAFILVLDSENETKVTTAGKSLFDHLTRLAARAALFQKNIKKAEGHLRRLGNENDKERAALWGDLAKTARKQEVWDVCRVAARFCLLYDDGRWKVETSPPSTIPSLSPRAVSKGRSTEKDIVDVEPDKSFPDMPKVSTTRLQKESSIPHPDKPLTIPLYERDLIRMMAEVNFINGEALIHFLRSEGVELGVTPTPPVDKRKHPKGYVAKKVEDQPEWNIYCDWLETISQDALQCFVRAILIGQELQEAWLVCCAAAYVWNYHNHTLSEGQHKHLINILMVVLEGLKKVGHAGETSLLCNICTGLAQGLIQQWVPLPPPRHLIQPPGINVSSASIGEKTGRKSPSRRKGSVVKSKGPSVISISTDAASTLKQATEVCEYAMTITNGDTQSDVVPMATRQPLLETWVAAKQLLQSQITQTFGSEDESSTDGQQPMTRAIVAIRMLELTNNGVLEFKEVPSLADVVEMVDGCHWSDHLVELQLWTRLTFLAFEAKEHAVVVTCAKKALAFVESGTQPKGKKHDSHKYMVEQELLSYTSCLYGQSLMENAQGKILTRRDALHQFLGSGRFACNAGNEELVMLAARHYWNTSLPLIRQKLERELLKEPLTLILQCIAETVDKQKYKRAKEDEDMDSDTTSHQPSIEAADNPVEGTAVSVQKKSEAALCGAVEDDLTLVAYMYGLLFQCYADKSKWQEGLEIMDQAITNMPKTNHRLLIFKHLVVVKATLGMDVTSSILRFKDESEDNLAQMWRKVALSSSDQHSQMLAYQSAIEALTLKRDDWLKVDLLIEFGQWLYCNEFPLEDATDQFHWAIDILLNMKFQVDKDAPSSTGKSRKGRKSNIHSSISKVSKGNDSVKKLSGDMAPVKSVAPTESSKASVMSDSESLLTTDLIPTEKKITIGSVLTNTAMTLNDLCDIRQLELLMRLHTLLAQVTGTSSSHHATFCLLAHSFVIRLWQVSLQNSSPYLKDLPRKDAETAGKGSAKKEKGKKDTKEKEVVKEKPKRKGPLDALPPSIEDWAMYDAPDEVIEAFKIDALKTSGINANTFTKPSITMVYLNLLVEQLKTMCLSHLTLPVLAMEDLLARHLIKSPPLKSLVHLRAMEVCIELNLMTGVAFHQPLAVYKLNEQDQARAREEAAQWKDRQNQMMKEELRLQSSMTNVRKKEGAAGVSGKERAKLEVKVTSTVHLGRKVGAILLRDVWTDTAEVLLHMALYQPARELLNEAFLSATAFDDKPLVSRILYLFAKLSFAEAQYGQAVNLCLEAQKKHDGEEMFWYETTILMVDSILRDPTLEIHDRSSKVKEIILYALDVFAEIAWSRPNRQDVIGFITAKLDAKLATVNHLGISLHPPHQVNSKELVSTACKKLREAANKLHSLGYYRNTVECLKEEAQLFIMLAHQQGAALATEKHDYYIEALQCLEEALAICEAQLYNFQSLLDVTDMRNVCPSQQRDTTVLKLDMVELMLEMFELYVEHERQVEREKKRKGSIVRVMEEVTRETPVYSPMEQKWVDLTKTMADTILVQLASAHLLAASITELKARALLDTGRCLRLLYKLHTIDPTGQWKIKPMTLQRLTEQMPHIDEATEETLGEDGESTSAVEIESLTTAKDKSKFTRLVNAAKRKQDTSLQYLTQAMDCLSQVVNLGVNKQLSDLVGQAALELVECIGEFDPSMASQYLALYQSCQASHYLEGLLTAALTDPTQSQTAALIHQRASLHADNVKTNLVKSPLMKNIQQRLDETSKAWARLKISPQHLEMSKDFPSNFTLVILQHSPDRSWLYGAVLEKPRGPVGGLPAKGSLKGVLVTTPRAQVVRVPTSAVHLSELLERFRWYKYDVMQLLLKIECQHAQLAQREKMLAGLEESGKTSSQNLMDEDMKEEEMKFQEEFMDLLVAMETYLAPVIDQLGPILSQTSVASVSNAKENPKDHKDHKDHQAAAPANTECVILLADQYLMQLPLEALQLLQMDHVSSVSREISLQMMFNKMHSGSSAEEMEEKGKKDKGTDKSKPPPRIPGLRDANKKQVKIIPLDRPVPAGTLPVDTNSFRYIVDPHLDCSETEVKKPVEVFNNLIEEHSQQFTPRWLGILGNEHTPSQGEYEIYMAECGAFIFYGMERFLGYIPPHKVAATNMPDCQLMVLLDQTQTSSSFSRQAKIDVHKTVDRLALEKPVETAMLLSLAGVNSILTNQWHCSLHDNAEKLDTLMKELLSHGSTTGHAVHTLLTPPLVKEDGGEAMDEGEDKPPRSNTSSRKNSQDSNASVGPVMNRQRFNLVCYGLPNIIVTQLSKV